MTIRREHMRESNMEPNVSDDLASLLNECLADLDFLEMSFIRNCYLENPKMTLKEFALAHGLKQKDMSDLGRRVMERLKEALAKRNVHSVRHVL